MVEFENAWLDRKVIGFAHQGGAEEGPPSTIETMKLARRNGAAALEFDLHLTHDKELVLHHDPELVVGDRTAKIADKDLAELRQIKPDLAELTEVLAAFPDVPLTVEIKARDAAEYAARALADEMGERPVIVTAFSDRTVAAVKAVAPSVDTAPGLLTILRFWILSRFRRAARAEGHAALQVALRLDQVKYLKRIPLIRRLSIADGRFVDAAHDRGLAVHVWTLNDEGSMHAALGAGADGIFTDRPSVLTSTLKAEDVYWRGPETDDATSSPRTAPDS